MPGTLELKEEMEKRLQLIGLHEEATKALEQKRAWTAKIMYHYQQAGLNADRVTSTIEYIVKSTTARQKKLDALFEITVTTHKDPQEFERLAREQISYAANSTNLEQEMQDILKSEKKEKNEEVIKKYKENETTRKDLLKKEFEIKELYEKVNKTIASRKLKIEITAEQARPYYSNKLKKFDKIEAIEVRAIRN